MKAMKKHIFLLAVLTAIFWTVAGHSATYWVRPTGTMSGCTSSATAPATDAGYKSTVNAGVGCLTVAGDILNVMSGSYNEIVGTSVPASATSWTTPTIIRVYPGQTATIRGSYFNNAEQFVSIEGFVIDAALGGTTDNAGLIIYAGTRMRYLNNEVKNSTAGSCVFIDSDNNIIQGGSIHDCGAFGTNQHHGIYNGRSGNIIDGVTFYNIKGGFASQAYQTGGTPSNNIYRNNIVRDSTAGFALWNGSGNVAYNNIFYNMGTVSGSDAGTVLSLGGGASGEAVYNNTIYHTRGKGTAIDASGSTNATVKNNIIWDIDGTAVIASGGTFTADHNLCDLGAGCTGTGSLNGQDPLFVNPSTGDLHLQFGSPAINAGISTPTPPLPFNGSAPDIGAYETATIESGNVVDTQTVDVQVGTAYAPFSGYTNCNEWTLKKNGVAQTINGCAGAGNGVIRLVCQTCGFAGGQTVQVAHATGTVKDSRDQLLMPWADFTVTNNLGGSSPVLTTKHFRCRAWNHNTTSNTPQDWYMPEDTACSVQNQNGKIAVMAAVDCTVADCPSTGFKWEFQTNGGPGWADITDSCSNNNICYDNTQIGGATHGASITSSLLTNPQSTYVTGWVQAQNSSFNVIDLSLNSATNILGSFALRNGLTAGSTQIAVRPKQDSGTTINHNVTATINVVNPGSQVQ